LWRAGHLNIPASDLAKTLKERQKAGVIKYVFILKQYCSQHIYESAKSAGRKKIRIVH